MRHKRHEPKVDKAARAEAEPVAGGDDAKAGDAMAEAPAGAAPSPVRPGAGDTSWFVHDRFGLFIHWGLYALPARHEWVQHTTSRSPTTAYEKYFRHFDPDLYDPDRWARRGRRARG